MFYREQSRPEILGKKSDRVLRVFNRIDPCIQRPGSGEKVSSNEGFRHYLLLNYTTGRCIHVRKNLQTFDLFLLWTVAYGSQDFHKFKRKEGGYLQSPGIWMEEITPRHGCLERFSLD
ncbi:hypothetical protein MPTK1_2g01210 [Marchantia polymorpha subsp. ruderalis]|uniref:Uncharacterized protein n=1 Tax=Marchantia polymorpha TaxID=3197 RepID=A0A2R6X9E8_MARPO|nr:hypothetical protein MARPO_0028s0031 [Marchantia polymorpha]BBN00687.1 hypothetical protein Mp_2g01210 [Marchantia polymorpha subsp. ruderalis]|eukprot:PTQ42709.1 hypothetical protein MARPO_0028s0031 [Marchantia polymorpha]